jgi:hypothetical protein
MMRTPDGHGRPELTKFRTPAAVSAEPENAAANTLGIRRIMFAVDGIEDVVSRLHAHDAELAGELEQYQDSYRLCHVRGPEASPPHRSSSSAEGGPRSRSRITIPQPQPPALRRVGERGCLPDHRSCAAIRLRHRSYRGEREFKATSQQLVTTSAVKEPPASRLQNNPICALLTAGPAKQSRRQNGIVRLVPERRSHLRIAVLRRPACRSRSLAPALFA